MLFELEAWPASSDSLKEWAINRIYDSTLSKQERIKLDIMTAYLVDVRSYHIDKKLSTQAFENSRLAWIIKGGKRLFHQTKAKRLSITKDILQKIINQKIINHSTTIKNEANVDAAFKSAWVGFLRLEEITYTIAEAKKPSFARTKVTREDVSFAEFDQYATIRLKRSKTDTDHSGVQIILIATNEDTCPILALRHLFRIDFQPPSAPLFRLGTFFSRFTVIFILRKRLINASINCDVFSSHSFRKGAAQHAFDHGMLDENIQRLGRWTSSAFQLYFKTSSSALFHLNLHFQKGTSLAVPRATNFINFTLSTSLGGQANWVNRDHLIELFDSRIRSSRHTNDTCHVSRCLVDLSASCPINSILNH
jgi:hypothetical protein